MLILSRKPGESIIIDGRITVKIMRLEGDVVKACPPSVAYRLRKSARRNQAALLTVGSFAVLLLVGAVLSAWQAIRATRAESVAIRQAERATIAAWIEAGAHPF